MLLGKLVGRTAGRDRTGDTELKLRIRLGTSVLSACSDERAQMNEANVSLGLPLIEILAPSELPGRTMDYFDYGAVAREAGVSPDDLSLIKQAVREEFPTDDMMWELHVLRACAAIRDGHAKLEDIVGRMAA